MEISSFQVMKHILVILLMVTTCSVFGQVTLGIKFFGLTGHLKKSPHPHLYPLRLDKKGAFVVTTGIILTAEVFVYKDILSVKAGQSIFSDCAKKFAGFSHLGFRIHGYSGDHHFSIGNGPTLFYRKDWGNLPGYVDEGLFRRHGIYQTRFFWFGGDIEYIHAEKGEPGYSLSILPGPPEFISLAAPGYSFIIR